MLALKLITLIDFLKFYVHGQHAASLGGSPSHDNLSRINLVTDTLIAVELKILYLLLWMGTKGEVTYLVTFVPLLQQFCQYFASSKIALWLYGIAMQENGYVLLLY